MFLRKILALLFFTFILSGCATYKFQKSTSAANQGYLVSYDDKPIIEYTVGKEKSLPDLTLAKERFKRRKSTVEYYYKKMGQIESRLKEDFLDMPGMFVDFVGGVFAWPFTAVADYRYNHNPKYKERVDKLEEEKEASETARINSLKEKLEAYIDKDLAKEPLPQTPALPATQEAVSKAEVKPQVVPVQESPVAVIIAKPLKGYSPLKVKFSGQKSYSKSGKIVSYLWDFGDGDTSTKKNTENTYWSTTYGARKFTATLTVKDEAGVSYSATEIIEVSTP